MEAEEEGSKKVSEDDFENLPPSYHNESNTETRIGNKTIQIHQEIDKVWDIHSLQLLMLFQICLYNEQIGAEVKND